MRSGRRGGIQFERTTADTAPIRIPSDREVEDDPDDGLDFGFGFDVVAIVLYFLSFGSSREPRVSIKTFWVFA